MLLGEESSLLLRTARRASYPLLSNTLPSSSHKIQRGSKCSSRSALPSFGAIVPIRCPHSLLLTRLQHTQELSSPRRIFPNLGFSLIAQTDSSIMTFLLTASAIGMLFKRGATISAAEGGCMAEVGVACSMAVSLSSAPLPSRPCGCMAVWLCGFVIGLCYGGGRSDLN